MFKKKHRSHTGQALVEFALIITVLLMIIFLIIEASRIMWGWVTVQNAARSGARYAITGGFDPDCATADIGKYAYLCTSGAGGTMNTDLRRPASIIQTTHEALSGLKLNETGTLTDDYGYEIYVWGVDDEDPGDGIANWWRGSYMDAPFRGPDPYGGKPNMPVAVRVIYYVPIITPFFRPIRESIPVYGQTILYNEPFDQLGGTGRSAGVPPAIPPLPTPGVTATFTPTPTLGPSETPTETPAPSSTATPNCPVRYTSSLVAGSTFVSVTGLWDKGVPGTPYTVTFYDITAGGDPDIPDSGALVVLGTAIMVEETGGNTACPGVGDTAPPGQLTSPLLGGHLIKALHEDGTSDVALVQVGTNTPTPTLTLTPTLTPSPLPTSTTAPTATPINPYLDVLDACLNPGTRTIKVSGEGGWPDETITIYFDGVLQRRILAQEHNGSFLIELLNMPIVAGTHTVRAVASGGYADTDTFISPCPNFTPVPVTPTPTDSPPDLVIISQPIMISTPPIVEYNPVQFRVVISNTGDINVNDQFFVDLYFDPTEVFTDHIPLVYSDGYLAIDSLNGGASQVITITSQTGFTGGESQREVYSMVDSLREIPESREDNNIAFALNVVVTPATPTPSPTYEATPTGYDTVSGVVRSFNEALGKWLPQHRAKVYLQDVNNPSRVIGPVESNSLGVYTFTNVSVDTTYTAYACLEAGISDYIGAKPAISPPTFTANISIFNDHVSQCPVP